MAAISQSLLAVILLTCRPPAPISRAQADGGGALAFDGPLQLLVGPAAASPAASPSAASTGAVPVGPLLTRLAVVRGCSDASWLSHTPGRFVALLENGTACQLFDGATGAALSPSMGLSTPLRRTWALGRACLDAPAAKTGMLLHATKPVTEAAALAHAASAAASRRGRGFATNPGLDEAAAAACGGDEGLVELLGYSHVRDPNLNLQDERLLVLGPGERVIDVVEQTLDAPTPVPAPPAPAARSLVFASGGGAPESGLPLLAVLTSRRVLVANTDLVLVAARPHGPPQAQAEAFSSPSPRVLSVAWLAGVVVCLRQDGGVDYLTPFGQGDGSGGESAVRRRKGEACAWAPPPVRPLLSLSPAHALLGAGGACLAAVLPDRLLFLANPARQPTLYNPGGGGLGKAGRAGDVGGFAALHAAALPVEPLVVALAANAQQDDRRWALLEGAL
eukprot:CAMPEP_0172644026 /NCGR_PEP_ID=MMETSP1068-20121228/238995_1 /TAXON_ID=35684 /ORGANISM="Pseudopedinella elastica, Strain CCMP716" /LENGTH=448 /DNA_ID=CAMNT_0013458207 /DNA_START=233 /DNA_END=1578 /DNA_ORIENTATION=-